MGRAVSNARPFCVPIYRALAASILPILHGRRCCARPMGFTNTAASWAIVTTTQSKPSSPSPGYSLTHPHTTPPTHTANHARGCASRGTTSNTALHPSGPTSFTSGDIRPSPPGLRASSITAFSNHAVVAAALTLATPTLRRSTYAVVLAGLGWASRQSLRIWMRSCLSL